MITLPADPRYTMFCPFCAALAQEWHPAERTGYCAACARWWRLARAGEGVSHLPDARFKREPEGEG